MVETRLKEENGIAVSGASSAMLEARRDFVHNRAADENAFNLASPDAPIVARRAR